VRIQAVFLTFLFVVAPPGLQAADVTTMSRTEIAAAPDVLPEEGALISGQPDEKVLDALADRGYVAVIDLREPDEDRGMSEAEEVKSRGMHYIALPVNTGSGINFENADKLESLLDSIDGPVLVHCGSGNRVGALFALTEFQKGGSIDASIDAGKAAGLTRLESRVRTVMEASEQSTD
jgi:uncharacterized protein (TIGR01244 family)